MSTKKRLPITIRAAILTVVGGGIFVLVGSVLTPLIQHRLDQPPIVETSRPSPTLTPSSTSTTITNPCKNFISKVSVGIRVYSANRLDTNLNIRKAPGLSAKTVGSVENGTEFLILGGPICVDDLMWWDATTVDGSLRGWIAEVHSNGTYYILPKE